MSTFKKISFKELMKAEKEKWPGIYNLYGAIFINGSLTLTIILKFFGDLANLCFKGIPISFSFVDLIVIPLIGFISFIISAFLVSFLTK